MKLLLDLLPIDPESAWVFLKKLIVEIIDPKDIISKNWTYDFV